MVVAAAVGGAVRPRPAELALAAEVGPAGADAVDAVLVARLE